MIKHVGDGRVKLPVKEEYYNSEEMELVRYYCKSNKIKLQEGYLYFKSECSFQYFCACSGIGYNMLKLYRNDLT
jgi:hypothetical protein